MVTKKKKKVSKKNTKRKVSKQTISKQPVNKNTFIYGGVAVLFIVVALAFSGGKKTEVKTDKPIIKKQEEIKQKKEFEIKDNKVSDIKKTKKVEPLNIPKKTKAINKPQFNEKAVQIRYAEIDYNSNKSISLNEYLYYFTNKDLGKKKFKEIDTNNNKSISYEEYLASKK